MLLFASDRLRVVVLTGVAIALSRLSLGLLGMT